jgi:hypothetical protein
MTEQSSLHIYGNVLISSEARLNQLKLVAPMWIQYWDCGATVRVRGAYAQLAADFLERQLGVRTILGQTRGLWRTQTFTDLQDVEEPYIFILLEDHMLSENSPDSSEVMRDITMFNCDVYQYSWFRTYEGLRSWQQNFLETKRTDTSLITEIDLKLGKSAYTETNLYLLSLSSIFKKSFLMQRLRSPFPLLRKFDPSGPFDIELNVPRRSQMPMVYGQCATELGLCLDDDHIVDGSSAIARGLIDISLIDEQQHQHYSSRSLFARGKSQKGKMKILLNSKSRLPLFLGLALRIDWLLYSAGSIWQFITDSLRIKVSKQGSEKLTDN